MPHSQHRSIWRRAKSPSPPPLKKKPPGRWCARGRGYGNTITGATLLPRVSLHLWHVEDNMDKIIVGILSVFIACDSCVLSKEQIQRRNLRQKWQFQTLGKPRPLSLKKTKRPMKPSSRPWAACPVLSCSEVKANWSTKSIVFLMPCYSCYILLPLFPLLICFRKFVRDFCRTCFDAQNFCRKWKRGGLELFVCVPQGCTKGTSGTLQYCSDWWRTVLWGKNHFFKWGFP